jgi:hypothetical protein
MGELDEAIREHLDLKRRRGADPAEVAREEQEALAPVTRGHAIVAPEVSEQAAEYEADLPSEGDAQQHADSAVRNGDVVGQPAEDELPGESVGDATQEFRVEHGDWLEDDDEV